MRLALLPLFAAALVAAAGCGGAGADADAGTTIAIHYSRFAPDVIEVAAGKPVTFTLRNDDPIAHEWIVGTDAVHERHRTGTEPVHDQIPSEVTIPALESRTTTMTFHEPGEYRFVCHLPGHEAYGMLGTLLVR